VFAIILFTPGKQSGKEKVTVYLLVRVLLAVAAKVETDS
jgi:hypothetical protein